MKKILALILVIISTLSFAACKKEPVIGYEPKIPPEWAEEEERQNNEEYGESIRTIAFDGIWKEVSTGKSFYVFNGFIFVPETGEENSERYVEWGTMVAIQMVEKERVDTVSGLGRDSFNVGDKVKLLINSGYTSILNAEITVISADKMKVTAEDGTEGVFKFVGDVDGWPIGYRD